MNENVRLKKRLVRTGWVVLAGGAAAAALLYLTAAPAEQNSLVEGFRESKAYRHELEAYGGKLSLVSDELTHWFTSLWQGEACAVTVGTVTAAVSLLLFWLASRIPPVTKG